MAPFVLLATLASILALVIAQTGTGTGTGTGYTFPSATLAPRYPFPNATFPIGPTATGTIASASGFLLPRAVVEERAPYPIPGGTGTGTGTGFALPTGYPKRMEMRGMKRVRSEKKRAARWW